MSHIKQEKMSGFPSRMAQSGTIVKAPMQMEGMPMTSRSYGEKNQMDYKDSMKKIHRKMNKDCI